MKAMSKKLGNQDLLTSSSSGLVDSMLPSKLSESHISALNEIYNSKPYPTDENIQQISRSLRLERERVIQWFRKRRTEKQTEKPKHVNNKRSESKSRLNPSDDKVSNSNKKSSEHGGDKLARKRKAEGVQKAPPKKSAECGENESESIFDDSDEDPHYVLQDSDVSDSEFMPKKKVRKLNKRSLLKFLNESRPKPTIKKISLNKAFLSGAEAHIPSERDGGQAPVIAGLWNQDLTFIGSRTEPSLGPRFLGEKLAVRKCKPGLASIPSQPRHEQSGLSAVSCSAQDQMNENLAVKSLNPDASTITIECPLCHLSFPSKDELDHHVKQHGENMLECPICNMMFESKDQVRFDSHVESHQTGVMPDIPVVYSCLKCKKTFKKYKWCENHKVKCGSVYVVCNMCNKRFKSVRYLKVHIKTIHVKPKIQCDKAGCDMKFLTESKLRAHIKSHDKVECESCGKTFKSKNVLKCHKNKHHGQKQTVERIWKCSLCPHSVKSERGLRYHKDLVHNVQEELVEQLNIVEEHIEADSDGNREGNINVPGEEEDMVEIDQRNVIEDIVVEHIVL